MSDLDSAVNVCSHKPCTCAADESGDFCSEACQRDASGESDRCSCGHDGCAGTEASRNAAQS